MSPTNSGIKGSLSYLRFFVSVVKRDCSPTGRKNGTAARHSEHLRCFSRHFLEQNSFYLVCFRCHFFYPFVGNATILHCRNVYCFLSSVTNFISLNNYKIPSFFHHTLFLIKGFFSFSFLTFSMF